MLYMLIALAIAIFLIGITRLTPSPSQDVPWRALLVWAVLLIAGVVIWLGTTHRV